MTEHTHPVLYTYRLCPYAMRARMALLHAGVTCELREVDLKNKPAHMLEISPKGSVPVLLLQDGTVLEQSLDIMDWAIEQNDPGQWTLENDAKREAAEKLVAFTDGDYAKAVRKLRRPEKYDGEELGESRERAIEFLRDLDLRLQEHAHLFANRPTKADYAIFPLVRSFRKMEAGLFDELDLTALKRWLAEHENSEIFKLCMEDYPVWCGSDAERILFAA